MEDQKTEEASAQPVAIKSGFKNRKTTFIALGVVAVLILGALLVMQGYVVAATVNGKPISRIAIIRDLERQAGQQAIDAVITKKLIADEARARNIVIDESELTGEIQSIESQMVANGSTLEDQLQQQGITEKDMRNQLIEHLTLEKLLGEKADVSEEEIDAYITDNKIAIPKEEEREARKKIKEQIREEKVDRLAGTFLAELKAKASIRYYVDY